MYRDKTQERKKNSQNAHASCVWTGTRTFMMKLAHEYQSAFDVLLQGTSYEW